MTRTYWLSFCDGEKPKGSQFLGACIVEVTAEEARDVLLDLDRRFPMHAQGVEWIAAASAKAWALGCNPGGEVLSTEINPDVMPADSPIGVLMSKARIEELGWL